MNRRLWTHAALGLACGFVAGCSNGSNGGGNGSGGAKPTAVTSPSGGATAAASGTQSTSFKRPKGWLDTPGLPHGVHRTKAGRYTQDVCDHDDPLFCFSKRLMPEGWKPGDPVVAKRSIVPETAKYAMEPADVIAAYNITSNTSANGAIVAIIDTPDSNALSDLQTYRTQWAIPPLVSSASSFTTCASGHGGVGQTPCFSKVTQNGDAGGSTDSGTADGEASLDMDMISAACADCSILLVEINTLEDSDVLAGVKEAITLGAVAISMSLGRPETPAVGTSPAS